MSGKFKISARLKASKKTDLQLLQDWMDKSVKGIQRKAVGEELRKRGYGLRRAA